MPKKDLCDKCCAFKTGNLSEAEYEEHVNRKEEARQSKENDKKRGENGECHVITMDVQAVGALLAGKCAIFSTEIGSSQLHSL